MIDDLFWIYFHEKECDFNFKILNCLHEIEKWIWSDKKNEYEHFLKKLSEFEKKNHWKKIFYEKTIFSAKIKF